MSPCVTDTPATGEGLKTKEEIEGSCGSLYVHVCVSVCVCV